MHQVLASRSFTFSYWPAGWITLREINKRVFRSRQTSVHGTPVHTLHDVSVRSTRPVAFEGHLARKGNFSRANKFLSNEFKVVQRLRNKVSNFFLRLCIHESSSSIESQFRVIFILYYILYIIYNVIFLYYIIFYILYIM